MTGGAFIRCRTAGYYQDLLDTFDGREVYGNAGMYIEARPADRDIPWIPQGMRTGVVLGEQGACWEADVWHFPMEI